MPSETQNTRRPFLRRVFKWFLYIIAIFIIVPVLVFAGLWVGCRQTISKIEKQSSVSDQITKVKESLKDYSRSEEQTYLTLPEWYIVYSADEYASFLKKNPPSQFPYFSAVGQYWGSYCHVYGITRAEYPFNYGYHVVLFVIGTSFSVENAVKGIYENTLGRITELLSSASLTEEDTYARGVAKEYGNFIHTIPWYEFPFGQKFRGLWKETHLWGPNLIRKWERKIALSLEYGIKAVYGKLIKKGTQTAYAPEDLEIRAGIENVPNAQLDDLNIKVIEQIDSQTQIISIPRYQAFSDAVPRILQRGVHFIELAGNDEILLTAIAPQDWEHKIEDGQLLFTMKILSESGLKRIAINTPITSLHTIVIDLENNGARIEHLYDY